MFLQWRVEKPRATITLNDGDALMLTVDRNLPDRPP
jgi:hypothetical protein